MRPRSLLPLLLAFALAACGGNDGEPSALSQARDAVNQAREAASTASRMAEEVQRMAEEHEEDAGFTYEPVDFRRLRELLPERLGRLEREDVAGETTGTMGFTLSKATATYLGEQAEGARQPSLSVSVTDLGAVRGIAMMGIVAWRTTEIDRETSTGYERTTEYRGHTAYERFSSEGTPHAEIQALVADRFLLQAEGQAMDMDELKAALEGLDIGALEGMRKEGRREVAQAD